VGLYQVSAVLGDGRRYSKLVDLKEGDHATVDLGTEIAAGLHEGESSAALGHSVTPKGRHARPRFARRARPVPDLELLQVDGAVVVDQSPTQLTFECGRDIRAVPTALLRIGDRRQRVSLPIGPGGRTPSGRCIVVAERTPSGAHAQTWISPERTVASGLQKMLGAGYVFEASQVSEQAVELLRDKYDDPPGAALGALLLQKVGLLGRWQDWLQNLAQDFAWLPDGKILLVQLHVANGTAGEKDLAMACEAAGQRILLAETYSLLLDVLRRWPVGRKTRRTPRHQAAIDCLASKAAYLDRDSICLSLWESAEG
jgi:hypothetical protein